MAWCRFLWSQVNLGAILNSQYSGKFKLIQWLVHTVVSTVKLTTAVSHSNTHLRPLLCLTYHVWQCKSCFISKYLLNNSETDVLVFPYIWFHATWNKSLPLLIKRTSKLTLLWVRYFAHGRRDTFQIVIKDCPKTTHAFTAILGSWHVSIFAQFFVHTDRLMDSVTLLHFGCLYANKNVVFMSSCVCWFGSYSYRLVQLRLFLVHMPKDLSGCFTKTCLTRWKERDYFP